MSIYIGLVCIFTLKGFQYSKWFKYQRRFIKLEMAGRKQRCIPFYAGILESYGEQGCFVKR